MPEQLKMSEESVDRLGERLLSSLEKRNEAIVPYNTPEFWEFIDKRIGDKIRLWAFGLIAAYAIPALLLSYTLGTLSSNIEQSIKAQKQNSVAISTRSVWIAEQERFKDAISRWAEDDPDRPFRPVRDATLRPETIPQN